MKIYIAVVIVSSRKLHKQLTIIHMPVSDSSAAFYVADNKNII